METHTQRQYDNIVGEIARLSLIIFEGESMDNIRTLAVLINHLSAILLNKLTISDFHDRIALEGAPDKIREYYYELLF